MVGDHYCCYRMIFIINRSYLYKMLSCLAEDDHCDYVMDWDHQGLVRVFAVREKY